MYLHINRIFTLFIYVNSVHNALFLQTLCSKELTGGPVNAFDSPDFRTRKFSCVPPLLCNQTLCLYFKFCQQCCAAEWKQSQYTSASDSPPTLHLYLCLCRLLYGRLPILPVLPFSVVFPLARGAPLFIESLLSSVTWKHLKNTLQAFMPCNTHHLALSTLSLTVSSNPLLRHNLKNAKKRTIEDSLYHGSLSESLSPGQKDSFKIW